MNIEKLFKKQGYIIVKNENNKYIDSIERDILNVFKTKNNLQDIHHNFNHKHINNYRLKAFSKINSQKNWDLSYYKICKSSLDRLIGQDLSIQTKLNLSIQMPHDKTSKLSLHTDTLSGQSEFEIVVWTPITNAYKSNSMYIFDIKTSNKIFKDLSNFEQKGMNDLFSKYKKKAKFLNLKRGEVLIFSSTLFHGNIVNKTKQTRVSINCRFKSIFAPEFDDFPTERSTGAFYRPLKLSPLTEWAIEYSDSFVNFK